LTRIIARRLSLPRSVSDLQRRNRQLESEVERLGALANIGTAACMTAHELNNILTPVGSYASLAL
jgi:C4-dicarboxylate-specific signal transduction histidine kinase